MRQQQAFKSAGTGRSRIGIVVPANSIVGYIMANMSGLAENFVASYDKRAICEPRFK
jgi:hypothetical protein